MKSFCGPKDFLFWCTIKQKIDKVSSLVAEFEDCIDMQLNHIVEAVDTVEVHQGDWLITIFFVVAPDTSESTAFWNDMLREGTSRVKATDHIIVVMMVECEGECACGLLEYSDAATPATRTKDN